MGQISEPGCISELAFECVSKPENEFELASESISESVSEFTSASESEPVSKPGNEFDQTKKSSYRALAFLMNPSPTIVNKTTPVIVCDATSIVIILNTQ